VTLSVLTLTIALLVHVGTAAAAPAEISPSPESSAWCTTFTGEGSGGVLEGWTGLDPNLPVCGPSPEYSNAPDAGTSVRLPEAYGRSFWSGTLDGFQCVELSDRWLAMAYGLNVVSNTNGDRVAANYYATYHASHSQMRLIASGTAGQWPKPGDVISFSDSSTFYDQDGGHVAVVVPGGSVNSSGSGTIYVAQENVEGLSFTHQALAVSHWQVNGEGYSNVEWLHVADLTPPGDGSFVSFGGRTYRVVGGYPLLVTDCGGISGGCGSPTPVSSLGAYRSTIANGTALYETDQGTGGYFSALGGTIVHVTSCAGSDAVVCRGGLQVNYASIAAYDQAHPTIANGTAIVEYDHAGGAVFSALGGTIVHVTSCSGQDARVCAGEVQEPYDTIVQYIAAHPRIANGTAIVEYDHAGGAVFSALGGTIVHVTSCSGKDTPVCAGEVQEPYDTIADYVHQHPRIANGTAIVEYDQGTGAYWSAIGGTIVHVTSCSGKDAPICHGAVQEPFDTIAGYIRQHPTIANSTVLYELDHGTGAIYKAAGGTLLHVTSCSGKDTPVCPGSTQENYATIAAIIHHHPLINPGTILHYQDHPPNAYLIVKHKTLQKTTPTRKAILLPYKTITTYAHQHHLKISHSR
jgi:hypothetical protein